MFKIINFAGKSHQVFKYQGTNAYCVKNSVNKKLIMFKNPISPLNFDLKIQFIKDLFHYKIDYSNI